MPRRWRSCGSSPRRGGADEYSILTIESRALPDRPLFEGISTSLPRYPRAMDEQAQPTIRITLDDAVAQGEYINFANIIHSPSEFVIDLGRIVPGRQDVKVYSRVIMTPLHAKQLLEALAQNISIFEQKFGEIRIDGASVFSSNEPSN
jgi:hypothetical protein